MEVALMEQTLTAEVKEDKRQVAGWLLYYYERRKEYEQRRQDIIHSTSRPEGPQGTSVSDTTGRKGQKLGDLKNTSDWLALVEEVEKRLPWKMQIILRLKRKYKRGVRGRPTNWLVALEYSEEISRIRKFDYAVGPDMVRKWWYQIIEYAARLSAKRGLLP
jgi:hypothetical protein